jgi:hypothetical protein
MGMGRGNRPVSIIVASGLFGLDGGLSDVRSAEPCARGPPSSVRVRTRATRGLRVRHGGPAGEDLPVQGPEREKRRTQHRFSPGTGLAKLVPVTASYVSW